MMQTCKILIIGLGGIGSTLVPEVASLGYQIGLMDGDNVEEKNLNRQLIHKHKIGMNKALSTKLYLENYFPKTNITTHPEYLTPLNLKILDDYDLIIDGTDNVEAKYLINNYCRRKKIKHLYISAVKNEGQYAYFDHHSVCLNCFYPYQSSMNKLMKCNEESSPFAVASVALKALNLVLDNKINTLHYFDSKSLKVTSFKINSGNRCQLHQTSNISDNFFRNPYEVTAPIIDLDKHLEIPLKESPLLLACQTGVKALEKCMELRLEGHENVFWTISSL